MLDPTALDVGLEIRRAAATASRHPQGVDEHPERSVKLGVVFS